MDWTFVYLMFVLKVPIVGAFLLVWWAVRQTPDPVADGGGDNGGPRRPHPRPPLPRLPRRGPHGAGLPPAPARVRTTVARARSLNR
jgi:hypothetical protein